MKNFTAWMCAALALCLALPLSAVQQATPTMKAIRYHEYGKRDVLRYEDAPRPVAGAGEVLVRVHAAGVNPVDWKVREGRMKAQKPSTPQIPGYDISGVVESVGAGVEKFKVGDQVFAYLSLKRGGAYAEYAVAAESELALKPAKLDFASAAAIPLAALTAQQALFDHGQLASGQTVLIHGAAGGVGHFAVQLAKARGATVIATASAANHEFLKRLGADVVIDYKSERFEERAKDVDVVLDTVGGDTLQRSYSVLKKGGVVVSIVAQPDQAKLTELGLRGARFLVAPDGAQLAELAKLADEGKLVPEVSTALPLEEAAKAHELSEGGHTRGKIVLRVVPAKAF